MKPILTKDLGEGVQVQIAVSEDGDPVGSLVVKADVILNELAKKIPGGIDDALFALIKAQLVKMGNRK